MLVKTITCIYAFFAGEDSPQERLNILEQRKKKYSIYVQDAERNWIINPTIENSVILDNLRECVQDVQNEINDLINNLTN